MCAVVENQLKTGPFPHSCGCDPDNKIRVAHVQNEAAQAEKVIKSEVDLALETPFSDRRA